MQLLLRVPVGVIVEVEVWVREGVVVGEHETVGVCVGAGVVVRDTVAVWLQVALGVGDTEIEGLGDAVGTVVMVVVVVDEWVRLQVTV